MQKTRCKKIAGGAQSFSAVKCVLGFVEPQSVGLTVNLAIIFPG